jgi:hypothetical protein
MPCHAALASLQARVSAVLAATTAAVSISGGSLLPQAWMVQGAHAFAHSQGVTALKVANK